MQDRAAEIELLIEAWEEMSGHYLNGRSQLIASIVYDLVERIADDAAIVIELGLGPGILLSRLTDALPRARLIGVEVDPVIREIHRLYQPDELTRIEMIDTDLAAPTWVNTLPRSAGQPSAVIAVQVLHCVDATRFVDLVGEVAAMLAPSGVFVHLDHVPAQRREPDDRDDQREFTNGSTTRTDPWSTWRQHAGALPMLADSVGQRDRQLRNRPVASAEYHLDRTTLQRILTDAGLTNVLYQRRIGSSLLTVAGHA